MTYYEALNDQKYWDYVCENIKEYSVTRVLNCQRISSNYHEPQVSQTLWPGIVFSYVARTNSSYVAFSASLKTFFPELSNAQM